MVTRLLCFQDWRTGYVLPAGLHPADGIRARWARCVATAITLPPRKGRAIAAAALLRVDQTWAVGVYEALAWVHDRRGFPEPLEGLGRR